MLALSGPSRPHADWHELTLQSSATTSRRWAPALAAAAVVLTGLLAAARLLVTPRFYFTDDTELGAFGQWWQLGDRLLGGGIPILDPQAWQAGNYFAEGQWGLLNPVTWVVAIAARWSESPVLHVTVVKILFLMLMAGGVYLLARSFGASAPWAAVAGVLVPLGGFTVYMDAASWATGLFNAAVLPWAWWGLRRSVESLGSPLPYLISSYALITFGYVFGVLILVVILVESLVRSIVERDGARIVRTLLASAWGALLTIVVYLPGVLTAPVTERGRFEILNTRFLNADLSDLLSASSPTATASIGAWWGPETQGPLVYVAWLLPAIALFLPMSREAVRRCIPLFVLLALTTVAVIGPAQIGALRWPVRFMPYVCLAACVLVAVMATHAFPDRITRRGVLWSLGTLLVATGVTYANTPGRWRPMLLVMIVQAIAILAAVWVARTRRIKRGRTRTAIAAAGAAAVSALLIVPQMWVFPTTPLPKFGVPDSVARMQQVLPDAPGDGIVVGDVYAHRGVEDSFDERLMANLWYLSPTPVSSLYTVLPYSTFTNDLCMDLRGSTCAEALDTLWSTDPDTGETVADLMGVSTILAIKKTFPEAPEPADGWRLASQGEYTWLYERERPIPAAGGVVWTGEGTTVTVLDDSDTSVSFRVDSVGADPRVVLSRLDYPGYSVGGAELADPVRDWLLTVDASSAQPGDVVTVSFRPPGVPLMVAALALGAVILIAWPILQHRWRRRAESQAEEGNVSAEQPAREAVPDTRG